MTSKESANVPGNEKARKANLPSCDKGEKDSGTTKSMAICRWADQVFLMNLLKNIEEGTCYE